MTTGNRRFGLVALSGRPNVGKSTLLNRLVGQKLAITSRRPQTTRHRIAGILTRDATQIVWLDTPGLHADQKRALNRHLNRTARGALAGIEAAVFVLDALSFRREDEYVLDALRASGLPVIAAPNKIDRIADKRTLLPWIAELATRAEFSAIVPVSARTGANVPALIAEVEKHLPEGEWQYTEDQLTDRPERFLAAEFVREQLTRMLAQELPYVLTVEIERYAEEEGRVVIHALIWVEKASQRAIVIGHGGEVLKRAGTSARRALNELLGKRVHLELWVRVRKGWSDDERALAALGYDSP